MSTKIELNTPYSNDYKAGYLNINKERRRVLALIDNNGNHTSTSYARYLMSCHIGRYLEKDEHVDHIDNDKMNDVLENYQILSRIENNRKNRCRTFISLICPICGEEFSKEKRQLSSKIKQGKKPTCSRRCGGKVSHLNNSK